MADSRIPIFALSAELSGFSKDMNWIPPARQFGLHERKQDLSIANEVTPITCSLMMGRFEKCRSLGHQFSNRGPTSSAESIKMGKLWWHDNF
jgi:hypothetical protein